MIINLDEILKIKGKTRYWLAKEIEVTYPTLCKFANRETSSVNYEMIEKICYALHVEIQDILIVEKPKSRKINQK